MDCPNCCEIENGEWRYYVSCNPDRELDLSEDDMDYEDSPIEFLDMGLDVLSYMHTCFNLHSCATLGSLSRLVQSLPMMIIMDENGKQLQFLFVPLLICVLKQARLKQARRE